MQRQFLSILGASVLVMSVGCGSEGHRSETGSGGQTGTVSATGGSASNGSGGAPSTGGQSGTGGVSAGGDASTVSGSAGASPRGSGGASPGGVTGNGGSAGSGTTRAGGTAGGPTTTKATGGVATGGTAGGAGGGSTARGTGGTTTPASGNGGMTGSDAGTAQGTGGTPTDGGTSQWPQCYANDTMPTAALKQRAPSTDYVTQIAYGGVAMIIGSSRQSCLTDTVVNFDVKDLNGEITDLVETLHFPGFLDWTRGYYMNWVILNSGISGATLSGQGGHQGDRYGHMNFESTEECPCNWGTGDSSNRGNALHESTHALQAELWAFNNQASGWIHEAHNCYLGTQRAFFVENKYSMGYGAAATLQMPHVPIESMGLLTDDTVGGPADQGADGKTYVDSINRYGLEIFFLDLNLEMGRGFVNCLWIDGSKAGKPDQRISSTKSVIQMLQSYAGAAGAANAVMTFGARSSILDFNGWTPVVRSTMQGNWNSSWWFYMFPGSDGTTTFSPPTKQIPHHQGRNIIPIKVSSGATSVTVEFTPDATGSKGTKELMEAQLTYRTTDDKPVYGARFSSGQSSIDVSGGARNGIVNFVVGVTNPNADSGSDDDSGKGFDAQEHFNYKARIVSGGVIAPTSTRPW